MDRAVARAEVRRVGSLTPASRLVAPFKLRCTIQLRMMVRASRHGGKAPTIFNLWSMPVGANPTPLSNAELAEWVTNELRKYEVREKVQSQPDTRTLKSDAQTIVAKNEARANEDTQEGSWLRAIIAGQQAISRDLPHLALTGNFTAAPAPQGGWTVRYSVRRADSFGAVPFGMVECVVAANGAALVQSPDVTPRRSTPK